MDGKWLFYKKYHDKDYIQSHDTRRNVILNDQREYPKYCLRNNTEQEIVVYKIDGGLIKNNTSLKCDYGIYTEHDVLYLVELKGGDYYHALEQIQSTIDILLKGPNIIVKQLNVRIVLSKTRTPNIVSTLEKKLNILLKKKYGKGDILKRTRLLEETI